MQMWAALPDEKKILMSDESYLLHFGRETGFRNALEGSGLRPTIEGQKWVYDCFDPKFREYAHVKWAVKYDPNDMSKALAVNKDGSLRFMLEQKHVQPMALVDQTEEDKLQLQRVRNFNRELELSITQRVSQRHAIAAEVLRGVPELEIAESLLGADAQLNKRITAGNWQDKVRPSVADKLLVVDSEGQHKKYKSACVPGLAMDYSRVKVKKVQHAEPQDEEKRLPDLY